MNLFGRTVEIRAEEPAVAQILDRELALYPSAPVADPIDLRVNCGPFEAPMTGLRNPSTHHELAEGFVAQYGRVRVRWRWCAGEGLTVDLHVEPARSRVRGAIARARSIQYTSNVESIGQILHELVLVPAVYFDADRFLLHAAAFQRPNGSVVAVTGTGGVGKTSLELEMCRRRGYRFVADDILVIDRNGRASPNLAFPKIYRYNVEGDPALRTTVLQGRSAGDLLNWRLLGLRGHERVRRRMSPMELYGDYGRDGGPLTQVFFLAREHRQDFKAVPSGGAEMASLAVPILKAEYVLFHQHLYWHAVNCQLAGRAPHLREADVFERWERLTAEVLQRVECVILRCPIEVPHAEFVPAVASLIDGVR